MATVVGTWHSAPRQPGATMLVGPDGTAVGSVSGGCVEAAVYELCQEAISTGTPVLQRYGISDDDAFAVGLTCGGIIDLYVEQINRETFPELGDVAAAIASRSPVAVLTVVEDASGADGAWTDERSEEGGRHPEGAGGRASEGERQEHSASESERPKHSRVGKRLVVWPNRRSGSLGSARLDDAATDDGRGLLVAGRTAMLHYGPDGERRGTGLSVFVSSYAPPARMIVFGAIDFAAAVARIGAFLGYRVTVCDARPVFATRKRFPDADEVVVDWPHRYLRAEVDAGNLDERTVICVLTHDPKFDVPVLEVALAQPFAYIGAMGSRRTHDDRLTRLREIGVPDEHLARLSSPIGLDLGSRTPEETAVSIAAEIIATRWGGKGARLSETDGRIHH
jgi:xanthine dehydrogenase accessory factor